MLSTDPITAIATALSFCGISSLRNFMPTFLLAMSARFLTHWQNCPDCLACLAEKTPAWLTSDIGLGVLGILAGLEAVANWSDTIRSFLEDIDYDSYAKPIFALCGSFAILTPEHIQTVQQAAESTITQSDGSTIANSILPGIIATVGGACTWKLCRIKAAIVAGLRAADPDNDLGLHWLAASIEESLWIIVLLVVLVLPFLALIIVATAALIGHFFGKLLAKMAAKHRAKWDTLTRKAIIRKLDIRMAIIITLAMLISGIPILGFLIPILAMNILVFGVFRLYENTIRHLVGKWLKRFFTILLTLVALVFSSIPFIGLIFIVPYLVLYVRKRQYFLKTEPLPRSSATDHASVSQSTQDS